jgi:hypothetical protein
MRRRRAGRDSVKSAVPSWRSAERKEQRGEDPGRVKEAEIQRIPDEATEVHARRIEMPGLVAEHQEAAEKQHSEENVEESAPRLVPGFEPEHWWTFRNLAT